MRDITELQAESLHICKLICDLCEKHHLRYYLGAGTLLGAIRHKGFIPWDDDMDIELIRKDYQKLRKILDHELGHLIVIQDYQTDKQFPFPFTKVFLRNSVTEKLHYPNLNQSGYAFVDLFPLSRCPSIPWIAKAYFKLVQLFTISIKSKCKTFGKDACGYTKKYALLVFQLTRYLPTQLLQCISWGMISLFHALSDGKYLCYPGGRYGYPLEKYKSDWYQNWEKREFEKFKFNIPIGWDTLLKHKYGDYWRLPDESERKGHFEFLL